MHSHHAVVHFAPVAIPLPRDAHRLVPTFGDRGLVHHADRLRMTVILGQQLLATVVEFLFIPLDGFEETL
jgi:hypothetical protein